MNALTGCTSADLRATQNLRATHFFLLLHGWLVCACAMHIVCLLIALREMSARPLLCAQRGAKRFLLLHLLSAYESSAPDLRITHHKTWSLYIFLLATLKAPRCRGGESTKQMPWPTHARAARTHTHTHAHAASCWLQSVAVQDQPTKCQTRPNARSSRSPAAVPGRVGFTTGPPTDAVCPMIRQPVFVRTRRHS